MAAISIFQCLDLIQSVLVEISPQKRRKKNPIVRNEVHMKLEESQENLQTWASIWTPETDDWQGLLRYMLGDEGSTQVEKVISNIWAELRKIQDISLVIEKVPPQPSSKGSIFTRWTKSAPARVESNPQEEELKDSLSDLSTSVSELEACAANAFSATEKLRASSNLDEDDTAVTQDQFESRLASVALFCSCFDAGIEFGLDLKLKPLNYHAENDDILDSASATYRYHLFRNPLSVGDCCDVILSGPVQNLPSSQAIPRDLKHVNELQTLAPKDLLRLRQKSTDHGHIFCAEKPLTTVEIEPNLITHESLESILERAQNATRGERNQILPLPEKIKLARDVAHIGFLLLGTPWLSGLRSSDIYRLSTKSKSEEDCYVLYFSSLKGSKLSASERSWNISEAWHIRQIGLLLTEIALGKTTSALDIQEPCPWADRMKVLPFVKSEMGVDYYEAVSFCLQEPRTQSFSSSMTKYDELAAKWRRDLQSYLEEYKTHVLEPILRRHQDSVEYVEVEGIDKPPGPIKRLTRFATFHKTL